MSWGDVLLLIAVGLGLFFALRAIVRGKKCGGCSSCGDCPMHGGCKKSKKQDKK